MRGAIVTSVFLVINCFNAVLSGELVTDRPSKDVLKLSMSRKSLNQQRRFRRHTKRAVDGSGEKCRNPAMDEGSGIENNPWKFENETKMSISISWIGRKETGEAATMLLLATTELMFFFSKPSDLYKSEDFGKTFKHVNAEVFNTHIRKDSGILKSPVNPNKVILVSHSIPFFPTQSGLVITKNGGNSWEQVKCPFQISGPLLFHPRQEDWILAKAVVNGMAYLSTDFGHHWKFLQSYVRSLKWGAIKDTEGEENTILMTVSSNANSFLKGEAKLIRSRDLGEKFEAIHVQHVYSFGLQGHFLYVSIRHNMNNNSRTMHVSKNGGDSWDPVQVPTVEPERFYSIMDMSEGMIFLHVDDPGDTGRGVLYTSDADGIVFGESLRNHVYTNVLEVTDFYKVESMRGTYITSRMNNDNSITTVISFNRGGEWGTIPLKEEQCKNVNLELGEKCSLQIHNRFSRSRGVQFTMGPLSIPNAVGIILAHGHPGSALNRNVDVWMTRDGGYTWNKVLSGSHHYSIGDHGNLIVAVPASSSTTKHLMYSVNEGGCWFKYTFTDRDFTVTGLVTEPGGSTMRFSLWGFTLPSRAWQVITVDFEKVLKRACGDDDYEDWIPHGAGTNNGCLLGRKVHIRRPKQESLCFNGVDYIHKEKSECCQCSQDDLECDYGYYLKEDKCVRDEQKPPELCIHGDVETDNLGHRRIPGDQCCGGDSQVSKYLDSRQLCKNASWYEYGMNYDYEAKFAKKNARSKAAVWIVISMLLILIVAAVYFGRKYWKVHKLRPSYRYSKLSQDDDEEMEGSESFKYDPRPKGLRAYRDCDTSDDDAAMIDL